MPESKYEFDQTRAAIGANELDNAERREMLERFKSAGGQVLREKSVAEKQEEARRAAEARSAGAGGVAARPAGGGGGAIPETKLPSELRREQAREEADRAQRARAEYEKALKKLKGPGARFMVKLRCFLAGITPFAGNVIKPGFVQFLNLELKQALIEFNLIGNDLFLQRPSIGKKIMHNLDGKNPLLMETLEYAHHMYNSEYFNTFATAAQYGAAVPVESAAAIDRSCSFESQSTKNEIAGVKPNACVTGLSKNMQRVPAMRTEERLTLPSGPSPGAQRSMDSIAESGRSET